MKLTTSIKSPRQLALAKRDAWEDEELREDEPGPSWEKSYVGGEKHRNYSRT